MPNTQSYVSPGVLITIRPTKTFRQKSPVRFLETDMPIGAKSMEIKRRSTGEIFVLINSKLSAGSRAAIKRERLRRS